MVSKKPKMKITEEAKDITAEEPKVVSPAKPKAEKKITREDILKSAKDLDMFNFNKYEGKYELKITADEYNKLG